MFQLDVASEALDKKFRVVNDQYYFTLKGADWMLPVSEEEYYNARDLSAIIAKIALVLTWAITLGVGGYAYYRVLRLDAPISSQLLMFLGAFFVCVFINLYPQTIPTMRMWQRLRQAQQMDDEMKAKLLVRRTELI
jgi:hypothetical protein